MDGSIELARTRRELLYADRKLWPAWQRLVCAIAGQFRDGDGRMIIEFKNVQVREFPR